MDDNFLPDEFFLAILDVLKTLPLRELTIRTFKNLGNEVWDVLHQFTGLKVITYFSPMFYALITNIPPRVYPFSVWRAHLGYSKAGQKLSVQH